MEALSSTRKILSSAKLIIGGDSLEVINTVGDFWAYKLLYALINPIWSFVGGYKPRRPVGYDSFYIPISNISSVGKKRLSKSPILVIVSIAIFALAVGASVIIDNGFLGLLVFILGFILAGSLYVVIRHRHSFTIEVNSGNEYMLISKLLCIERYC